MIEVLVTSSVLIAVIALLRLILRGRIRPGLQYALWGLVLLRLLVPGSWFHSPVSVAGAAESAIEEMEALAVRPVSELSAYFTATSPNNSPAVPAPGFWAGISLESLAISLWITGAIVLGVWFASVNCRLAAKLYRERQLYSTDHASAVYVVPGLPSPCLFGGEVYLTEEAAADPVRAEFIIAHEMTHRRHGDGLWAALRVCCLAVYWFNPFVWLAATLSRRDCEIFCDAATVKTLGEEHRFDYGRTLLDMTAVKLRPADLICSATTMSGSGRTLQERIKRIARQPRVSALLCVVVVLIAALTVGFTFSGTNPTVELSALMPQPAVTPEPAGEAIGTYDREYWDEVADVFGPFLEPGLDMQLDISGGYIVGDAPFDLSFEDFVYSSDSWEFSYFDDTVNPDYSTNGPIAAFSITAADGRTLRIFSDHGLLIGENGEYSIRASLADLTGHEMIAMLFNWAQEELGLPVATPFPEERQAEPAPEQEPPADTYEDTSVFVDAEAFEDSYTVVAPWDSTPRPASTPTPTLPDSYTAILDSVQNQIEGSSTAEGTVTKLPTVSGGAAVSTPAPVIASATDLPDLQPATATDLEGPEEDSADGAT